MGILGKLMFWKKEDVALPEDLGGFGGPETGLPGEEHLGLPSSEGLPGLGKEGADLGMPSLSPESPSFAPPRLEEAKEEPFHPSAMPQPAAPQQAATYTGKDLEIISLKLDSLKTTLEAVNERLARLEKMAEGGSESHRRF
jgi:hypothetical protein